jgi:glycosyltransferase involved in cell wall biosynthesis
MDDEVDAAGIVIERFGPAQRSLRVAVVTETWPPEVNGVAMSLARMVDGLRNRGHDIQLIRPRQGRGEVAERQARFGEVLTRGVPIPRYPNLRLGVPAKRRLVQLWSVQRPDVVHIATEGPLGGSALRAAMHLKLPTSSDFRTNFHSYSDHYGVGWLRAPIAAYLRKFHNRTNCTMVPTEALRRELEQRGFRRLRVVARGVDRLLFAPERRSDPLRAQWGATPEDLVVACVGRLAAEKNLATVALAFDAIRARQPRAKLLLVGDGPMRADLQSMLPDAVFAGQRSGEDLATHYASADLFLFASLTETFGNVTVEAMASGLPVVAFDYAAAAQLIRHGENGMLAPCDDRDAFVAASVAVAGDPERRRRFGEQARLASASIGWDSVVARFEQVLSTVAGGGEIDAAPARFARGVPIA